VSAFHKIYNKVRYRLFPPTGNKPDSERVDAVLADGKTAISVETALNSRCTSDYDSNPKYFHWGMFDKNRKLTSEQIMKIMKHAKVPRFTDVRTEIRNEQNMLMFIIDNRASGISRNWLMVENGMQQQAIGLVCSALGVGMIFSSFGSNRPSESESDYVTTRIKLDPMKPSYEGAFWTTQAPSEPKPWLKGNLSDPARTGQNSLLETLASLQTHHDGRNNFSEQTLSQLLWAARGRTPHYYKSEPWGLTIPTNRGQQNNSSLYVMKDNRVHLYVNWSNNRPAHSLALSENVHGDIIRKSVAGLFPQAKSCLIIAINETADHAYWEAGYQLLNILLQAKALDLNYRAVLLKEEQIKHLRTAGINNAVAAIGI
jgi:hypothetical protein